MAFERQIVDEPETCLHENAEVSRPFGEPATLLLLCSASGYVLREVQDFVFSLLSAKSLVVPQHIIGTGCGCRRDGRVADTDVGSRRQRIGATGQQLVETPAS